MLRKAVTLNEFVAAFAEVLGHECSEDTWLHRDLLLDDDELGWVFLEMDAAGHIVPCDFDIDPYKYLQGYGAWPFGRMYVDITIRELHALSQFKEKE